MTKELRVEAIAGTPFDIILKGDGIGGYQWVADRGILEHFGTNFINKVLISRDQSIGGGVDAVYTFKFDNTNPPLHKFTFVKERMWSNEIGDKIDVFVTVYP